MEKSFKFRYTNEIVGGFVFLALVIMVAGIFIAGRAQGWFERRDTLRVVFVTDEGAFGLKEGDEVKIRDTVAGNVGKISPTQEGTIEAVFQIKHRFLTLLKKGSVAKVRKKFGFAGDAFVEIVIKGTEPLQDGDPIACTKDEELMDIAKNALTNIQEVVMPIMKETREVLANINQITGSIKNGDGMAGTLVKDNELAEEVKKVIGNVNSLMIDTRETVNETRKLIKGVQKHWLWRKYMDKDKGPELLVPLALSSMENDSDRNHFASELKSAREADDSGAIALNAYNLAVCMMEQGKTDDILPLIHEARAELAASKKSSLCTYVLESQALKKAGKVKEGLEVAQTAEGMIDRSTDPAIAVQSKVITADLKILNGDIQATRAEMKKIEALTKKVESPVVQSMTEGLAARLYLAEDNPEAAAGRFDREAGLLKGAGLFEPMAQSFESSGKSYEQAKNYTAAADRYFRAGRSLYASGRQTGSKNDLKRAVDLAKQAGDRAMEDRIKEFQAETEKSPIQAE